MAETACEDHRSLCISTVQMPDHAGESSHGVPKYILSCQIFVLNLHINIEMIAVQCLTSTPVKIQT